MTDTKLTPGQKALTNLIPLFAAFTLTIDCSGWAIKQVIKIATELIIAADLLTALEALVAEPSDDWRDATDDDDGHTRTPRQRALKQARAAIAKAKRLSSHD